MVLLLLLVLIEKATSFVFYRPLAKSSSIFSSTRLRESTPFAEISKETNAFVAKDSKGQVFTVGGIVQVALPNIKAYQIMPAGRGIFDENKTFVPDSQLPYLVLPVGLRGKVKKVYDIDVVSANFPVQVVFQPGEHSNDYDSPVKFVMHFDLNEIECV